VLQKVNDRTMLDDRSYHYGKKLVQIYIPAASSLYFGLGSIWGLPAVEQIVGTLAVVATFIGVCIGLSSTQYDRSEAAYDGEVVVEKTDAGGKLFSLQLEGDPEEIEQKKTVAFKVKPSPPETPPIQ
jgi:Putative phage holin Dp-1